MNFEVTRIEIENFRGKKPSVQIVTLSCSYEELLHACRAAGQDKSSICVLVSQSERLVQAIAHVALVHPVSAPAMLTIPQSAATIMQGAKLTLAQVGA